MGRTEGREYAIIYLLVRLLHEQHSFPGRGQLAVHLRSNGGRGLWLLHRRKSYQLTDCLILVRIYDQLFLTDPWDNLVLLPDNLRRLLVLPNLRERDERIDRKREKDALLAQVRLGREDRGDVGDSEINRAKEQEITKKSVRNAHDYKGGQLKLPIN